ncbi:hypothetical protein CLOP_g24872 [Closterium sp. NIES-67]|nr:hypothetical protein CLOP_g24872 [Closterium sp. NIES-67]
MGRRRNSGHFVRRGSQGAGARRDSIPRLRGDSHLTNLTYGRFMDIPPEPPVDADLVDEWTRVRGNKSLVFLRAHRPHLEKYWRALPLAVLGGINLTECSILEPSRDRVYLVMCWLHRALVARRMAGGISQDAPIVSRIYQVLSDGMLGYENALKIVNTPFPFPFAQCVALLLHINALIIPLLMADWLADPYLASAITSSPSSPSTSSTRWLGRSKSPFASTRTTFRWFIYTTSLMRGW